MFFLYLLWQWFSWLFLSISHNAQLKAVKQSIQTKMDSWSQKLLGLHYLYKQIHQQIEKPFIEYNTTVKKKQKNISSIHHDNLGWEMGV